MMDKRYDAGDLVTLVKNLFHAAGMEIEKCEIIAPLLVEADLIGHTTHGIAQVPAYLKGLENGQMSGKGQPTVVADRGPVIVWDGNRISGVWLTATAIDLAIERAKKYGIATVSIRRSGHIACLAAFLSRATEEDLMIELASSDPSVESVAPYGGIKAAFTPNPIAVGIPTNDQPLLIDISASITTNGLTNRYHNENKKLPGLWVQDNSGEASDDPGVLFSDPPGTILPIGGKEYGHKGFGLALIIESLTQGLSGFGRADPPEGWGASVYLKITDPRAYCGIQEFKRQTTWLANSCRNNPAAPGFKAVRLPGDNAFRERETALQKGVSVYPGLLDELAPFAAKFQLDMPKSLELQNDF
ncbi:MAG: Ldh family oxidoreductase [Pseudomonadota bacterium]|nr:Ldh family oxidoreductase [Nisaea sp.]MEC9044252.1 Ldh family oxidoreductase [Pseudomonadota bacterium]MEC9101772.1 Ldh family oxidoreductase [Pseudomonadota bacterium]|tara:strand:+ start:1130 stop:2203 length:1074 start_codon:yes stop_codon:yes gene_type:complete